MQPVCAKVSNGRPLSIRFMMCLFLGAVPSMAPSKLQEAIPAGKRRDCATHPAQRHKKHIDEKGPAHTTSSSSRNEWISITLSGWKSRRAALIYTGRMPAAAAPSMSLTG